MKKYPWIILLAFCISPAFAQTDTTYIQPYAQKFNLQVYTARNFISIHEQSQDYLPNNPMSLGVGIAIKNSILSLSYGFNISNSLKKELPQTESFDFQLHHYGKKYMLDLYLQNYKGFYKDADEVKFYPEMQILQIGAEGTYIFDSKRFSARAAFGQSERQVKPAGSWLIGTGAYFFKAKTGITDLNDWQIGVNVGYTYSYVFNKNWFLSGEITGSLYLNHHIIRPQPIQLSANSNGLVRFSAGYNTNDWCVSMLLLDNIHFFRNDLRFNSGSLRLVYVRRFEEIPFLGKNK
jgi:hypothetical protein